MTTIPPPPPSPQPNNSSSAIDMNAHSDFYKESWGLDNIPVSTQDKGKDYQDRVIKEPFLDYLVYKNGAEIPEEKYQEWKDKDLYNKWGGLGLIVGKIKYGPNKGLWINFFDADNALGKEAILRILGYESIDALKKDCVVEYHPTAPDKFHVFALSKVPFDNFAGLTTNRDAIKKNEIPGFEIKGKGSGLAYPTPALHANGNGERYQLIDGSVPVPTRLFDEFEVNDCERR